MKRLLFFAMFISAAALIAQPLPLRGAEGGSPTTEAAPSPATAKARGLFDDILVAKGKGVEVKRNQLDEAVVSLKSTAAARGQAIPASQTTELEQQVLNRLIQIQLLMAKASEADKARGQELSAKRFDEIKNRDDFNRQLTSVGLTAAELRARMVEEATAQAVVERELKINITDEDAKKFYDENPARFEEPEKVRASHILVATRDKTTQAELSDEQKAAKRKQAEELLSRARAGEDFAKLAREFSDDYGSKERGGEYIFARNQMVSEFETAAFGLKPNQISDLVTTQFGYHIIKLSEKIPAKKTDFATAQADIKEYLKMQSLQKLLPDYIAKLRKEAGVQILDEKLKAADSENNPSLSSESKPDKK